MAIVRRLEEKRTAYRRNPVVKNINEFIGSPWGVMILGLLTLCAFAFSLEIFFYTVVAIYATYVGIFGDDFKPLMPLFIFCYIAPSINNNPGKSDQGLFYGATGVYLICIVSVAIITLFIRLVVDDEIGKGTLFTKKRSMLLSMVILGVSYLLSGIGSEKYLEYAKSNLLFACIQFASVALLYFIFSASIKWDKMDLDYFACIGLVMGLVVAAEVGCIYLSEDVIVNGEIIRGRIYSGWGCYNNIGAIISMSIPFAFYFANKVKHGNFVFLLVGCFLLAAVFFSCSRGSMVGGVFAFAVSFIYTFIKSKGSLEKKISIYAIIGLGIVGALLFGDKILYLFNEVPSISDVTDGSISFNDSGRFDIYLSGIKVFLDNPVFGQTFYPASFPMYDFSDVEAFSSFFPPRWYNTVIQMLASCGSVGMIAYSIHRIDTIRMFLKKRTDTNVYIAISILALLGMSLLDCHFFNVGPVFFYSMALAVMEFGEEDIAISYNY